MSDDPSPRGKKDRTRIDVTDDHDLRYWSRRLDVSRDALKQAVAKVGDLAAAVAQELSGRMGTARGPRRSK